jgi:uncharacterized protein (TIGR00369 family)
MNGWGQRFLVEEVAAGAVRLRMIFDERMLRPGGTVSGPAMFALADIAMYAAVLAHVGPRVLAVTSNLNINFLRKPAPGDILGEARLLRLGKRLAFGEIAIHSAGEDELAAHATATYAIPDA